MRMFQSDRPNDSKQPFVHAALIGGLRAELPDPKKKIPIEGNGLLYTGFFTKCLKRNRTET